MLLPPSSYLKSPWSNLISPTSTLLSPSSVKRTGFLTQKVLKIARYPTKCSQAQLAPLAAFSRSVEMFSLNASIRIRNLLCTLCQTHSPTHSPTPLLEPPSLQATPGLKHSIDIFQLIYSKSVIELGEGECLIWIPFNTWVVGKSLISNFLWSPEECLIKREKMK